MKLEPAALFETDEAAAKAKAYALRLLGNRAYTQKEIRDKLAARGYAQGAIDETLLTLERLDLVDDALFARQFVAQRLRLRPAGRVALARDLARRGVAAGVIDLILDDVFADVDVEDVALDLMMRRANRYRGLSRARAMGRMYGFLERRGFEASVVRDVVQKVWTTIENEEGLHTR